MKIAIGCDHGGYNLKEPILHFLAAQGHEVLDFGTNSYDSVDYPDYAAAVARAIQRGEADKGILLCGTGIGITIAANKFAGIRAAVVDNEFCAIACAAHNAANVLGLGGRVVDAPLAVRLVELWLTTPFEPRHQPRLDKITAIERENSHN